MFYFIHRARRFEKKRYFYRWKDHIFWPIMKYSLYFKCRKSFVENGRFEQISFILECQRAAWNQQTKRIPRFINRFDDCKKVCSPNMWVCWQHSCSNAVPIMIDNLLRTSPEMVTWARNGHIKSVVLLFMYYWMQICYKCWKNSFCLIKIMITWTK